MIVSDDDSYSLLDQASDYFNPDLGVHQLAIEHLDGQTFLLVRSETRLGLRQDNFEWAHGDEEFKVPVLFETTKGVFNNLLDTENCEFDRLEGLPGAQIVRPQGGRFAGTLGASFEYFHIEQDKDKVVGNYVFVSNNHVLAYNDAIKRGTPIEGRDSNGKWVPIGKLKDYMHMKKKPVFDIAIATLDNPDPTQFREIPGIGKIKSVTGPKTGTVYSKSGITTGVTSGKCLGRTTWFRYHFKHHGWRVGGNRFSCFGDSGSMIMNGSALSGIHVGANHDDCAQVTEGIFEGFDTKNSGRSPRTDVDIVAP